MIPLTNIILATALHAMPCAYELDFRALPAANTTPAYKFTYTIELEGKPEKYGPVTIGMAGDADVATESIAFVHDDPLWNIKRDGNRLVFYSYDKLRVTKITVAGDGPKPVARRVLLDLPAPKK